MESYRSREETKVSSKQREPYYIHTANGREPVNPRRTAKPSPQDNKHSAQDDTASTLSAPLINPKHPPEICPPSTSRWRRLKDENEARKSREVTRVSYDDAARISGRDERGFKNDEEDGWTDKQKDLEAKRAWECVLM